VAEPRDTLKVIAIPRLMFAALVIFGVWYAARQRNRPGFGTVIVDGTPFVIDGCKKVPVAGPDSIGADVRASGRNVLRLVRDEQGVQLWIYSKGSGVAIPVDKRDCSQWDVNFFSETADLNPVGGDATFTCATGGGKIDGTVFFEHCRP
jgi:hypothetical protein